MTLMTDEQLRNLRTWAARTDPTIVQVIDELLERRHPPSGNVMPDGRDFVGGTVVALHVIGQYTIVEYLCAPYVPGQVFTPKDTPKTERRFHPYFLNRDSCHSYLSLDEALVGVIAMKYDGVNTRADQYFGYSVGLRAHPQGPVNKSGSMTWDWGASRDQKDDPPPPPKCVCMWCEDESSTYSCPCVECSPFKDTESPTGPLESTERPEAPQAGVSIPPRVVYVRGEGEDPFEAVYVDGQLAITGHYLSLILLTETLGLPDASFRYYPRRISNFPVRLTDLEHTLEA